MKLSAAFALCRDAQAVLDPGWSVVAVGKDGSYHVSAAEIRTGREHEWKTRKAFETWKRLREP